MHILRISPLINFNKFAVKDKAAYTENVKIEFYILIAV